ncbi:hypothetical protein ACF058_12075 [Streptomyces sp. NPDC015501]|uniref:hypothetical protein n=1 Tax=unclassified Streptomyces TaxID=2593676 RepID=UPI00119E86D3|nr:hypothetical protein A3L22_12585 [Streptomyces griseus subsp. griseus]
MRRTGTTRRGALTATGALALGAVLTGCGGDGEAAGGGGPARSEAERAERALREKAVRDGALLLARYDLVAEAHPATAAGLAPLRAAVAEHGKALAPPRAKGAPRRDGPEGASAKSSPPAPPGPVAADPGAAVKELATAERRRADAHAEALLTAGPELARLLASVAAAAAAHAYLLTGLAEEAAA